MISWFIQKKQTNRNGSENDNNSIIKVLTQKPSYVFNYSVDNLINLWLHDIKLHVVKMKMNDYSC